MQAGGPVSLTKVGSTRRMLDLRPDVENDTGSDDDEEEKKNVEQANHAVQEIFMILHCLNVRSHLMDPSQKSQWLNNVKNHHLICVRSCVPSRSFLTPFSVSPANSQSWSPNWKLKLKLLQWTVPIVKGLRSNGLSCFAWTCFVRTVFKPSLHLMPPATKVHWGIGGSNWYPHRGVSGVWGSQGGCEGIVRWALPQCHKKGVGC